MSHGILQRPTLVLNRNWQPIHVATVARAVIMLYSGTVRVVDPQDYQTYDWEDWSRLHPADDEHCIRSVSHRLRVPEVVVLAPLRRAAGHDRAVQPPQHLQTRSVYLPILRTATGD